MDIPTLILFAAVTVVIVGLTTICIGVWAACEAVYRYWTGGDK